MGTKLVEINLNHSFLRLGEIYRFRGLWPKISIVFFVHLSVVVTVLLLGSDTYLLQIFKRSLSLLVKIGSVTYLATIKVTCTYVGMYRKVQDCLKISLRLICLLLLLLQCQDII